MEDSESLDIPITRLRPLRDRQVTKREYDRIVASLRVIGLIEPLIVFPDGDNFVILDGVQRYRGLLDLGVAVVPCILGKRREAFTGNRMVNRVSPIQENRMIERSMEELDAGSIAAALGISGIAHRLKRTLLKQLHPDVAAAFDKDKITRACAQELTSVKPARQKEIIGQMDGYKDYSIAFARTLILKTPPQLRNETKRKHDPWDKTAQRKADLIKQLTEAEQKHDFYSRLYKQYTVDLLRLAIFARELLSNARVRPYLNHHHAGIVERFEAVITDARG
ncbi:MAG TPA: plasmid partitioning protein RepB C-terminal domain-containing protein [Tepidisphaeraceae bacterium]|nr:plasmid partitioning protein RepB C-terminal domain-containing protein [Tepidisphaeraceae bacterium]